MQQRGVRTTRYYFAIVQDSNCRTKIDKGELRAGYIYRRGVSVDSVLIIAQDSRMQHTDVLPHTAFLHVLSLNKLVFAAIVVTPNNED